MSRLAPGCSLSQSNDDDDVLKALADVVCQVQAKFRDHNPKLQEENATLKEEKAKLEEKKAELEGEKAKLEEEKRKKEVKFRGIRDLLSEEP